MTNQQMIGMALSGFESGKIIKVSSIYIESETVKSNELTIKFAYANSSCDNNYTFTARHNGLRWQNTKIKSGWGS